MLRNSSFRQISKSDPLTHGRLWADMNIRFDKVNLHSIRVLLLGLDGADRNEIRDNLRRIGVGATGTASNVSQLGAISNMTRSFTHLIVNIDSFPDLESAIVSLMEFRQKTGEMAVVIVSSQVQDDDLSQERRSICDATLRLPVTEQRLRRGLLEASVNNREFQ